MTLVKSDEVINRRYLKHPFIVGICRLVTIKCNFSFNQMAYGKIEQFLREVDAKKASQDTDIPTTIIMENSDLFAHFILKNYNHMLIKNEFP